MAWSLANKASNRDGGSPGTNTFTLTITSSTAGRCLVAHILLFDAANRTITGVAGNTGGAWTQHFILDVTSGAFDGICVATYYLDNCPAGVTSVTVTCSGATSFKEMAVYELVTNGVAVVTDGVVSDDDKAAVGTVYTGETLTTTGAGNGAAFGFYWDVNATQNPTTGNEFDDGGEQFAGGSDAVCLLLNPTSAAHTPTWVGGLAGSGGTFTVAFKDTGGAAAQVPYDATTEMATVVAAWPASLEPRLHPQNTKQNKIASLIIVPPSPFTPGRRAGTVYPAILLAQQDAIATILVVANGVVTPPASDQPPRQFALSKQHQAQIGARWTATWGAQSAPKGASWHVPPVLVVLPHVSPPQALWTAWVPPFVAPPRRVSIAPLTLTYGQAPPRQFPLAPATLRQIAATWAQTWGAQTGPKTAAWHVAPSLVLIPRSVLPGAVLTAWVPPFVAPPRPVSVAPLTFVYGAAPPPRSPFGTQYLIDIAGAWAQTWDAQQGQGFTEGGAPPPPVTFLPAWAVNSNRKVGF